ncbi:serine/threonine-protein phosphatase 6 regulatory subunit 3-like isoform X20 [Branchiostoma floridae x Branchiostoma belcheri]
MFWKFDLHTTSHIDTLLDKEDVTLTELLDEDDVLQECKAQNRKLIDFLIRPEVMEELVNLITQDPPDDVEEKIRYKYPNTACELLTSDVSQINDKLGDDEALLNKLWAFLEAEPPLNPLLASFFSKVMGMLLARKTAMMLDFLRQKEDVVGLLITHLSTSAIMDLLLRLLTSVDAPELRTEMLQWLDDQKLIQRLIEVLDPTGDEEKHSNAAQSLCDIIRLSREHMSQLQEQAENDPLLTTMEKQETVEELLNVILNGEKTESALVNGISVLLTLLEFKKPGLQYFWSCSPDGQDQMTPLDAERLAQGVSSAILGITPRLKELHQLLIEPPKVKQRPMPTSVGTMDPPFGNTRLHVCRLMASLLLTNTHQVNIELANLGTLDIMLDCFFQYTWNNFLHTQVEQCINTILTNPPSDDSPNQEGNPEPKHPLINNLLGQSRIIQRILDKWEEDQQIESQGGNRRGYMGHLTRIANSLQTCLEKGPNKDLVKEIFKEVPEDYRERWETFVSGSLAEINKKNTVDLVGSHPLHSSSEDDDSDFKDIPFPPDSSLQQAFSDYQMQQMTSTFIDQFGFNDEEFADQEENVNAPFDRISDINFSTNANEENPNSALFEACCNERISTFDDSGSDEEDVWEEKELTFSSVVESRQSTISTTSNDQGSDGSDNSSDSEEDAEDTPSPLRSDKPPPPAASSPKPAGSPASPSASEDTKMDVDNSDGWTATFDEAPMDAAPVAMETGAGSWDDVVVATNKPGAAATDDGNNPQPRSSSPVAMETNEAPTDGLRKGVAYLMASAPPDLATSVQQSARLPEVGESSTDPEDEFTSLRNSQPLANTVEAMNVDEPPQQTEQPNRTGATEGKPASDTRPAETGESPAEDTTKGGADGSREASETVQGSPAKDGSSSLKQGNSDNRETRTSSSSPSPSPSASATKLPQPNTPTSVGDKDQSNNNTQHQQQQQQQQGTEQGSPGNTNDPTEELSQNFNILSSGVTKTGKEGEEPKTAPPPGSPNTDNSHVNQTDPPTTENSVEMKIGAMETMRPEGTKPPVETLVPATGAANGPV